VSFANSPNLSELLSSEFASGFQLVGDEKRAASSRRTAELALRRDQLAQELETRIGGERRASKQLLTRWRELDRLVREEQQQAPACDAQLQAVESALAETDARLRYRRLELDTELRWKSDDRDNSDETLAELDEQIARSRATMAQLAQREAAIRARLATLQSEHEPVITTVDQQQAWLAVARQLSGDLAGEVSRLARATASQQCVCRDAHPRLRPIAETIERQLEVLESLLAGHQSELQSQELRAEADHLGRAEAELQRYVELLLGRRQVLAHGPLKSHWHAAKESAPLLAGSGRSDKGTDHNLFSAADLAQLEQRRIELEHERFQLTEQSRVHRRKLRDLRAQRDTVGRQRAALLSARSMEHVQRELADIERKLVQAMDGTGGPEDSAVEHRSRASDYLAQLTDGKLVRLLLVDQGRRAQVINSAGESLPIEALPAADRDRVYLSFCLALLSAAAQRGVWLPLVLDDPFLRLDPRGIASLAAVLDAFCRQGHQVIVFTGQLAAAQRLASLGATVREIASLRYLDTAPPPAATTTLHNPPENRPQRPENKRRSRSADGRKRKTPASQSTQNGKATDADRSDAA
jgi:hypothetical protein